MLPLWARANTPFGVSISAGWAFSIRGAPIVE
jgi:hypothetical protein